MKPVDSDPAAAAEATSAGRARPKDLPSLDKLLHHADGETLVRRHGHSFVAGRARALLEELRQAAVAGDLAMSSLSPAALARQLGDRVCRDVAPRMRTVFNLTGTVIHTNLGRALLAESAIDHTVAMMKGPNNLEYDLASGGRGDRDAIVEDLLCEITGAEAATVVNNNAAAVLLTLAALARGREVVVSRGELVEIGGAFRMPDVMAAAGARLVEVGTTNRTHPRDYEQAIGEQTALLMKVHPSNYSIEGFTASVGEATLAEIGRRHGIPLATDLGSGSLVDLSRYGLAPEPTPQQMLAAGCGIVTFSGDKLLGGPQAGIIVGSRQLVSRIRKTPLKRALRMSKLPLAALEATLRLYLEPEHLAQRLPTLRLLVRPVAEIRAVAGAMAKALDARLSPHYATEVVELFGQIGSGSLPKETLASAGVAIRPAAHQARSTGRALQALELALRQLPTPVIGRVSEDRLLLDMRCLEDVAQFEAQLVHLAAGPA